MWHAPILSRKIIITLPDMGREFKEVIMNNTLSQLLIWTIAAIIAAIIGTVIMMSSAKAETDICGRLISENGEIYYGNSKGDYISPEVCAQKKAEMQKQYHEDQSISQAALIELSISAIIFLIVFMLIIKPNNDSNRHIPIKRN